MRVLPVVIVLACILPGSGWADLVPFDPPVSRKATREGEQKASSVDRETYLASVEVRVELKKAVWASPADSESPASPAGAAKPTTTAGRASAGAPDVLPLPPRPEGSTRSPPAPAADREPPQLRVSGGTSEPVAKAGSPCIQADVTCSFIVACAGAKDSEVPFTMGFPVQCKKDPIARVKSFIVEVDDKPVDGTVFKSCEINIPGDAEAQYLGYSWPASIRRGATQKCVVKYSLLLPASHGEGVFTYILRTGGTWSRPLGKETVYLKAEKGLRVESVGAKPASPSVRLDEGTLIWALVNARPEEDVRVKVFLPEEETSRHK